MAQVVRIIPKLDIKGPNLVKGIHLEGLRVLGKPEDYAEYYYQNGADELLYMDVVASLFERNSLDKIIQKTAKTIFIPLTVGGGIRSVKDIKRVLRAGADKVAINTAAINNPKFIAKAANIFGSSTISISIEASKQSDGEYLAFTDNGREHTGVKVFDWVKQIEKLGAGEIIITSIDKEGTGQGFDLNLTQKITQSVSIPVVACGGAGKLEDIKAVILEGQANAVSLASVLHYEYVAKHKKNHDKNEGNIEFLNSGKTYNQVKTLSILKIKKYLQQNNIPCRL
jgi:imidazole glycerol-phosphate synthase subunit HisF